MVVFKYIDLYIHSFVYTTRTDTMVVFKCGEVVQP